MKVKAAVFGTLVVLVLAQVTGAQPSPQKEDSPVQAADGKGAVRGYGVLPLSFEPNQGQTNPEVHFLSQGRGYTLFLTPTEAVLALEGPSQRILARASRAEWGMEEESPAPAVVHMKLVGANATPTIVGVDELPGKSNYFIGNNPKAWRTNVSHFAGVRYAEVYPGVDLVYYANPTVLGQLEYDFIVAPGADPSIIRLAFQGADLIRLDPHGNLHLDTTHGEIVQRAPVVYQEVDGTRQAVASSHILEENGEVAFHIATYDHSQPLVIDPVLVYSTFLGGSNAEETWAIAVDADGNAYVAGITSSFNFPTTELALDTTCGSDGNCDFAFSRTDGFVAKLNAAGTDLAYSTFVGGDSRDWILGVAVDASGAAYIAGGTTSTDFPITSGVLEPAPTGTFNGFVAKLSPSGDSLVYSTYFGQGKADVQDIAVGAAGDAYLTGAAFEGFRTTAGVFQDNCRRSAFAAKLNPTGSDLVYSTCLGGLGSSMEQGLAIALNSSENAHVTGFTISPDSDFPLKNAFQSYNPAAPFIGDGGSRSAFVTKFNSEASDIVYSTYLGGSFGDFEDGDGRDIAVDSSGNAYVVGTHVSPDFPTFNPIQPCVDGSEFYPGYLTKFNPNGEVIYSTCLPSTYGIAADSASNAYVTGVVYGSFQASFPIVEPLQTCPGSRSRAYVAKLNPAGSEFIYSTCLGEQSVGLSIAVDGLGNAYVTGDLTALNFEAPYYPITPTDALQPTYGGGQTDAFVAKISPTDNTPAGANVTTSLTDEVTVTFDNVTESGTTSLTVMDTGPAEPSGFSLGDPATYFEISTTATFAGLTTVCINYSGISYAVEADLRLFHFENGEWVDQTISLDTVNKVICAVVSSLSPFAVFSPPVVVEGLFPPLAALVPEGDTPPFPNKAFKQGSTLPLKLHLSTGNIVLSDQNSAPPHIVELSRSAEAIALEAIDLDTGESNDSTLLFRFSDGQWVYNLGTHGLISGTYTITIQMPDGLRYVAALPLR